MVVSFYSSVFTPNPLPAPVPMAKSQDIERGETEVNPPDVNNSNSESMGAILSGSAIPVDEMLVSADGANMHTLLARLRTGDLERTGRPRVSF